MIFNNNIFYNKEKVIYTFQNLKMSVKKFLDFGKYVI